jgi:hypothetical protein
VGILIKKNAVCYDRLQGDPRTRNMILDSWAPEGTTDKEFLSVVDSLSKSRQMLLSPMDQILFIAHRGGDGIDLSDKDNWRVFVPGQEFVQDEHGEYVMRHIQTLVIENPDLLQEIRDVNLMIYVRTRVFLVSDAAFYSIARRFHSSRDIIRDMPGEFGGWARAAFLASKFNSRNTVRLLAETDGKYAKLLGVMSDKYRYIPQDVVFHRLLDDFAKDGGVVSAWRAGQMATEVCLTYPAWAKADDSTLPGIRISTSDVAEGTLSVQGILMDRKNPGMYLLSGEEKLPHLLRREQEGQSDLDDLAGRTRETIYPRIKNLQERMDALRRVTIIPDVTDAAFRGSQNPARARAMQADKTLLVLFRELDVSRIVGKQREMQIRSAVIQNLPDGPFTAHDCLRTVLALTNPHQCGFSEDARYKLRKAAGAAVTYSYEKFL